MTRRQSRPLVPSQPEVPPEQGILLLERQIESGEDLLKDGFPSADDYSSWELLTGNVLRKVFGHNSPNVSNIENVGKWGSFPTNAGEEWWAEHRAKSLRTQIARLKALVELLQTELRLRRGATPVVETAPEGHRILLVHGRDERSLHETARFLAKLEQDPIVLREQPSQGQTIIEKLESCPDIGFAVVLLTGDDRGGLADRPYEEQSPRARQNVIFELGYVIGRLGRERVCPLYVPGVEIPSDFDGVVYVELDNRGAWRLELARELKAAGLPVDMNLAL